MRPTETPAASRLGAQAEPHAGAPAGEAAQARALCVSIHDVAPDTWPACMRLLHAVRAVADFPLTWLVVPRYHGSELRSRSMEDMLGMLAADGHELALHGYTHLDTAPAQGSLRSHFLRTVYTQGEGEFAALDAGETRRRLALGLAWFEQRGWPVCGFVAPAWLLGEQVWPVLREFPFEYTTTLARFHLLPARRSLFSPSLVYTARNGAGRTLSPRLARAGASLLAPAQLVRLGLHPRDAGYPELVRHAQRLIERLLTTRSGCTKASFARRLASTMPAVTSTAPSTGGRNTDTAGRS